MIRLATLLITGILLMTGSAHAKHLRHHANYFPNPVSTGLTTVKVVTGQTITVATDVAARFQALVADLASAGYKPHRISCYATSGHVAHSRHYVGKACDFDGSLSRNAFMRTPAAHQIVVKHGFRDGCSFYVHGVRDCGHVDDGLPGRSHRFERVAIHKHARRAGQHKHHRHASREDVHVEFHYRAPHCWGCDGWGR